MGNDATSRYLALLRGRPRPSIDQMQAFASFVANDHSWYKKLPLLGAGEPFFLYLDPFVHAAQVKTTSGATVARDVIRELGPRNFYEFRIDLQPGDVEPGPTGPLRYIFGNTGTDEYRERYGYWSYWNWGRPDQPRDAALADAAQSVFVLDDDMARTQVPEDLLDLGLVYLRATISGDLGPTHDEYERLRHAHDLPDAYEDQAVQFGELIAAMQRIVDRVYPQPDQS